MGGQGTSRAESEYERLRLRPDHLRAAFSLDGSAIPELDGIAGQDRAREAIAFGLSMRAPEYNLVVSGAPFSGRNRLVREHVDPAAAAMPPAADWVYIFNFADPRQPRAISVSPGMGDDLERELTSLIEACRTALPAAFASDTYETRSQEALAPIAEKRDAILKALNQTAHSLGFAVNPTPMGWMSAPLGKNGQPLTGEEFAALPAPEQQALQGRNDQVQEAIATALRELRQHDLEARERILALDREVTRFVVGPILDDVGQRFGQFGLAPHFAAIEADIVANLDTYKRFAVAPAEATPPQAMQQMWGQREALLQRYAVNLFVSHGAERAAGAPVIDERHASYLDLFGRIEFENQFGALVTDFIHVRAGALHLANGGYLILQAQELFADPRSWPKLKLALKTREVRFDDVSEGMQFPVVNLLPEGIPLDVKVILVGPPQLFAILDAIDPEFADLFRIRAEFEPDTIADSEAMGTYHGFVDQTVGKCGLHPFDAGAIVEILHFGSRLAGRQDRLSTQLGLIAGLCQEADQFTSAAGAAGVSADHVRQAVAARERRSSLLPDRIRRMIGEGILHVETKGSVVGQINGLAVFSTGTQSFGAPTRITCRTGVGRRGVVAIERETERSGSIHTKGVLVLDGFLSGTFGHSEPLAFNASLTFEQSYGDVEGDSASSAELYAILTSLANVPVRQDIAVTGSVDQFGNVQAVGGVTEKVEGFFDVCKAAGLTGEQGVIIPATNRLDLTLRADVVDAVAAGSFHLWAVRRVEEGLELLTGIPAGIPDRWGIYPVGTVFAKVTEALARMRLGAIDAAGRERR